MKKEIGYRISFWLMIFFGLGLAITLAFTSLKTIRGDKNFTQMILDANETFLVNTLHFGHEMMSRMGNENYQELIDLALRSKFIRYLAIIDKQGKIIAQSDPIRQVLSSTEYDPHQFKEGSIVRETGELILVSYRADEIIHREIFKNHTDHEHKRAFSHVLHESGWFLVALDISDFKAHYHHAVIQTVGVGAAFLLFGVLIIIFLGSVQRYELAHLSIERLNKIKSVLGNFVPETAKNIIERDPEKALLDKYLQDATVLFLDVEGFSRIVQMYPQERINRSIEFYFSMFFDLIQKNGGDVNETAGDGMMAIFLNPDPIRHARNAVQTALKIQRKCLEIINTEDAETIPLQVNIGISSGEVYLGSTKMKGAEGDRWTFTAAGPVTILAARLADYANQGQILVGEETARRIRQLFSITHLGKVPLKNLENAGEIYQLG